MNTPRALLKTTDIAFLILIAAAVAGCAGMGQMGTRSLRPSSCRLQMIYGGGPSRPSDDPSQQRSMVVFYEVSDSTYEFGHLADGGFEGFAPAVQGVFRIEGGETRDFAIRHLETDLSVYPVKKFGSCEFVGPQMRATQAIFPTREKPYYSITRFNFIVARDTVLVELTTSSPNGFATADS